MVPLVSVFVVKMQLRTIKGFLSLLLVSKYRPCERVILSRLILYSYSSWFGFCFLHQFMCVSICVLGSCYARGIRWSVCFSPKCLSSKLIIGVFHFDHLSVAKTRRRRRRGQNPTPSRSAKNHSAGVQSSFFLGNPAPWIAGQKGHFRSKAGNVGEMLLDSWYTVKPEESDLAFFLNWIALYWISADWHTIFEAQKTS